MTKNLNNSFIDCPPYRLSGIVIGTLLNHIPALEALGDAASQPPYKAPPKAPVLYVKPANTLSCNDASVVVPTGVPALEVGAALGIVIGKVACRIGIQEALQYVAGYAVMNDICVPHDSFYRPSIRFRARDGFCSVSTDIVRRDLVVDPDNLTVKVWVDGDLKQESTTGNRIRNVARLLVDVSEYMTLNPGDILMLGTSLGAPLAATGQLVEIEIESVGRLRNRFVAEDLSEQGAAL